MNQATLCRNRCQRTNNSDEVAAIIFVLSESASLLLCLFSSISANEFSRHTTRRDFRSIQSLFVVTKESTRSLVAHLSTDVLNELEQAKSMLDDQREGKTTRFQSSLFIHSFAACDARACCAVLMSAYDTAQAAAIEAIQRQLQHQRHRGEWSEESEA
jgi:hypothetical protein